MAGPVVLRRVAQDALPILSFVFEGVQLTTQFALIELELRFESGKRLLPRKQWVIDDDINGVFHFEFAEGEIPAGTHRGELLIFDLNTPTDKFTLPDKTEFVVIARDRA